MTRRKTPDVNPNEQPIQSLNALLSEGDSDSLDSFSDVNARSLERLVYCVSALGGMVTFWYDRANYRLCFSMRLGSDKKSYQVETAEQFNLTAEYVVSKLTPALQSLKKRPPNPPT